MNRFLQDAANILDVAINAVKAGHQPTDTALLIGADGSIQIVCGSDWTLDALCRLHGTSTAYRVRMADGVITVDARDRDQRCHVASPSPRRTAQMLLGTNSGWWVRPEAVDLTQSWQNAPGFVDLKRNDRQCGTAQALLAEHLN